MSKVDAQRAMREAKYAQNNPDGPRPRASSAAPSPAPAAPAKPARKAAATASAAPAAAAGAEGALCGHTSMNGRACTREAGHSEKSHRYS